MEIVHLFFLPEKVQLLHLFRDHVLVLMQNDLSYHIMKNLERGLHRGSIDFLYLLMILCGTL